MRLVLHGGFGEKGRTSIGVETGGYRLLLDAGVNTSARGRDDYYPRITRAQLEATDAIVVTHGHEDHVAALGWCLAEGFRGRIFMTAQTRRDTDSALDGYAEVAHRRLVDEARIEVLNVGVDALRLGPLSITTGRSGHVAGGVWCALHDGRTRFDYCGDVLPSSAVFEMDALPACDAMAIDASYGEDPIRGDERARQITEWVAAHQQGCVLPTPLYGRSAELLALVEGPLALASGMRDALAAQIEEIDWLIPGIARPLSTRLHAATEWREGEPLPRAALVCHDGMGMAGPAKSILAIARSTRHPTLITGHLPEGTLGQRMVADGYAEWIRLPTHPTLNENVAMVRTANPSTLLGHSCDRRALTSLARHLPQLRAGLSTGDAVEL
jgi:Cft2 family RNA processing exonuclease